MQQHLTLPEIDFGQPEAENDALALMQSFYEFGSWKTIIAGHGMPFVIGRKGSGKSAIAARLELQAKEKPNCAFIRIVPASFRHVEIRDLLACLVNRSTSWQYIYKKVWEGIILGQIVNYYIDACNQENSKAPRLTRELESELDRFSRECSFYVRALNDALTDVIEKYVRDASKKTDALSQVELRKMLEPYKWDALINAIQNNYTSGSSQPEMYIAIDGLDEHWDTSEASLYFLAQLLAVAKDFTAKLGKSTHIILCLRDNIFRALVDTKSIEYDKIESLIINLEWNTRSLFEMIARRVAPTRKLDAAVMELRELLPETVNGHSVEDYLSQHILHRPRDYINLFRMLQKECAEHPQAGEGHVQDAVSKYCANRLMDLENEFGFTYPGISKCISALNLGSEYFDKATIIERLRDICSNHKFREEAPILIANHGDPVTLARILLSIGVIGTYDRTRHSLRFIHEFSESRVKTLWESNDQFGIHPVYKNRTLRPNQINKPQIPSQSEPAPAIIENPSDYLPEDDDKTILESSDDKTTKKRNDLIAELNSINSGQAHFRRFENWVRSTMELCFTGDLYNAENQIRNSGGTKIFEIIFDITSSQPPWLEIKDKHKTHRLLVECKNTDEPTDADFTKLERDMNALQLNVAFLAYRGKLREPKGKVLEYQRSIYINSRKEKIIVTLSEAFLLQCLTKKNSIKCRNNMNSLWRDSVQRWLIT